MSEGDTPGARYAAAIARGDAVADPGQAAVVARLDALARALGERRAWERRSAGRLARWLRRRGAAPDRGLYLWGGVGRGKTWLMGLFHDSLPFAEKRRVHFHGFMRDLHAQLKVLGERRDPLAAVADRLSREVRVLCFDEFHVVDIADAMILGRLLGALFERGVVLVATSNLAPADLYRDGLQRRRFLPAVELLERHTHVVRLDGPVDYRLRALERAPTYHHPLGEAADRALAGAFARLQPRAVRSPAALRIGGREVAARALAEGVAWFTFPDLCETPRAASDYLEIARAFHTVLLGDVPVLDDRDRDRTVRFVHLIDALYDRNVNLVISAAAAPARLYRGRRLEVPFARARSRLEEMRTRAYLARAHLP